MASKYKPTESESDLITNLIELRKNLALLGWIESERCYSRLKKVLMKKILNSKIVHWFKNLDNGRIINQGIIANGAGVNLDWLDENNEDLNGFTV